MFQSGDFIIYGNSGVCQVVDVSKPDSAIGDENQLYYKLLPLYNTETIYIPVSTTVFMRPIITRQEAEALIAEIPFIKTEVYTNSSLTMLKAHYEASLQTHACEDLIQLISSISTKSLEATQNGKKLGQVDQRYLKLAENLLHGELAVALEIPREAVQGYIETITAATF